MKIAAKLIPVNLSVGILIVLPGSVGHQATAQFQETRSIAPLASSTPQGATRAVPSTLERLIANYSQKEFNPAPNYNIGWRFFSRVRAVAGQPTVATAEKRNFREPFSRFAGNLPREAAPLAQGEGSLGKIPGEAIPAGFYGNSTEGRQEGYSPRLSKALTRSADAAYARIERRLISNEKVEETMDGRIRRAGDIAPDQSGSGRADVVGKYLTIRASLESPKEKRQSAPAYKGAGAAAPQTSPIEDLRDKTPHEFAGSRVYGSKSINRVILAVAMVLAVLFFGWCLWDYLQWKRAFEDLGIPVLGSLSKTSALGLGIVSANPSGWHKPIKTSTLLIIAGLIAGAILVVHLS